MHYHAEQAKRQGFVYPPSTAVGQYGVIKQAEFIMQMDETKKRYRRLKKRMRENNLYIDRVLSNDTEFLVGMLKTARRIWHFG